MEVTDETGTPVKDALVSFRLPDDGVSGLFGNGLKTEILSTDNQGRAGLRNLRTGALAGQFQIKVTVASGEARAGAISTQFIHPSPDGRGGIPGLRSKRRILEISALVLAAVAVGYVKRGGGGNSAASAEPPPSIGPPIITIGKH